MFILASRKSSSIYMKNQRANIFVYWVPALAFLVVAIQLVLCNTWNLTKWKGGGFGMYSEVHFYYHDVFVSPLSIPLDSLQKKDTNISDAIMQAKRMPSDANLRRMGELVSKYASSDTITIKVWKPQIDAKTSRYSRELMYKLKYIKPL